MPNTLMTPEEFEAEIRKAWREAAMVNGMSPSEIAAKEDAVVRLWSRARRTFRDTYPCKRDTDSGPRPTLH